MPVNDAACGRPTSFRVTNLHEPQRWRTVDRETNVPADTEVLDNGIRVHTRVDRQEFLLSRT
jgi:hypothetical protein